ncbi:MAG: hypothetical protein ACT4N4_03040, partial [Rhodospirillales bacterium]
VVVWESDGPTSVYGQRYDANGTKVGAEFVVNTTTTGTQAAPAVAGLAGGGFVVVWDSNDAGKDYARSMDSATAPMA